MGSFYACGSIENFQGAWTQCMGSIQERKIQTLLSKNTNTYLQKFLEENILDQEVHTPITITSAKKVQKTDFLTQNYTHRQLWYHKILTSIRKGFFEPHHVTVQKKIQKGVIQNIIGSCALPICMQPVSLERNIILQDGGYVNSIGGANYLYQPGEKNSHHTHIILCTEKQNHFFTQDRIQLAQKLLPKQAKIIVWGIPELLESLPHYTRTDRFALEKAYQIGKQSGKMLTKQMNDVHKDT